jgi:CheY-like chemotaxis protein
VRLDRVRVLLVDDSRDVLDIVTVMLELSGAEVMAVDTAEKALEALTRTRPDVLLSDLQMPGNGGYWLIGQVRALPSESGGATPAAAMTGLTGPEHRSAILGAGFQYHIEKPLTLDRLIGVVAILALKE